VVEDISGELRARGITNLIGPADADYETARHVWNGDIDRRPAIIVRCRGPADVRVVVNAAREAGLTVAIRGGAHNAAGHATCDGGIVIDMSPMKGIRIAPDHSLATAQAGVLWSELDRETQAFGLATPGGMVSNTGISGLTLGGGISWLMGKHGLTIDNVLGFDVVTAGGELLRAEADINGDLFWALRGGGGNFGVVTSIDYRLHQLGPLVFGGLLAFPLAAGRDVLRYYREFSADLPDAAEMHAGVLTLPTVGAVVALLLGYNGDPAEGERCFRSVQTLGKPAVAMTGPIPHVARQTMLDVPYAEHGPMRYWKSASAEVISDEMIDALLEAGAGFSSPESALLLFRLHGEGARVPIEATACPLRGPQWDVNVIAQWRSRTESERHKTWARSVWRTVGPLASGAAYMNHLSEDDGADRVRAAFGPNYTRLADIKRRYDPTNLFRLNPNVRPVR
jgi:FAD/FMN-containing dehydrogenase